MRTEISVESYIKSSSNHAFVAIKAKIKKTKHQQKLQ